MKVLAMLVVIRGNSGSGKSTIARLLQTKLGAPTAVLQQDHFRRVIYHERENESLAHKDLLEMAATYCIGRGHNVILEGIFNASRYGEMLERVAEHVDDARFYAFDLTFEETALRHLSRAKATEFSIADMQSWYHGWQPLSFVAEQRILADEHPDEIVERILHGPAL
ncbi:kinase [Arthrobacter sp. MYb211]|nr:kinase [Arthrobacter sp. MYb229]PRA09938.1 kinase [Arthrobacter sp. MYb221]PRB47236.1 kinase [Arthrobacter sp. MYb216]PRC05019.1 kinase [Arthrobacter sp. MYb211]